ncbi:MAG: hypothetical protein AAGA81_17205 [Acidobacteriota bacterium]
MTSNPTRMLPELDLCADGQLSEAESTQLRGQAAEDVELGAELRRLELLQDLLAKARVEVKGGFSAAVSNALAAQSAEQSRFARWLSAERIEVRPGFADDVCRSVEAEVSADCAVAGLLESQRVPVRDGFADQLMASVAVEREAPCSVSAALAQVQVDVRPDFVDQVMASVRSETLQDAKAPANDASWTLAGAAAAVVLLVGSMAVLGSAGGSSLGLLGMLGDFASMTLLAGAGMLGATWAGVGSTVDAWLGSSVANWAVALLLVVGLAFLCQRTVRRARVSIRRD